MPGIWELNSVENEKHVQSIGEGRRGLCPSEQLPWTWDLNADHLITLGLEFHPRLPALVRTDVSQSIEVGAQNRF